MTKSVEGRQLNDGKLLVARSNAWPRSPSLERCR